jgi:hypothetical protein
MIATGREVAKHIEGQRQVAAFLNERSDARAEVFRAGASPDTLRSFDRETQQILSIRLRALGG